MWLPSAIAPGWRQKRSQIDSPRPSSNAAPSICAALVATPQTKSAGKIIAGSMVRSSARVSARLFMVGEVVSERLGVT